MSWGTITVTNRVLGFNKHSIKCDYQNCGHTFNIGEKAIRKNGGRSTRRYFCLSCADKMRL